MNKQRVISFVNENEFGKAIYLAIPLGYKKLEHQWTPFPIVGSFGYLLTTLGGKNIIMSGSLDPQELYFLVGRTASNLGANLIREKIEEALDSMDNTIPLT